MGNMTKDYTLNDGTVIDDAVADSILEDVYQAVDSKSYKIMTDKFKKRPQISIPAKELRLKLLDACNMCKYYSYF